MRALRNKYERLARNGWSYSEFALGIDRGSPPLSVAPSFSPQDRATYYRERAQDALLQAELASEAGRTEQHESFLHMAGSWHAAAIEIEQRLRRSEGRACEIWQISSGLIRRVA